MNGLETIISSPVPLARAYGTALTSYLPAAGPGWDPDARGVERWRLGVKFTPHGAASKTLAAATLELCEDGPDRPAPIQLAQAETFQPYEVRIVADISLLDGYGVADLLRWAQIHYQADISFWMASQVERDSLNTGNPSLVSSAAVATNTDQSLLGAVAAIEDGLASVLGDGVGMVHVSPSLLTVMAATGAARQNPGEVVFRTACGHVVIADAGYSGPTPVTGVQDPDAVYIYGSGPVVFKTSPLQTPVPWEDFDFTRNRATVDLMATTLTVFDPSTVVTAAVDISDASIENN